MRPGEWDRTVYRVFQAANRGKAGIDDGLCYACGEDHDLRWWIVDEADPWGSAVRMCAGCVLSWRIKGNREFRATIRERHRTVTTFAKWLSTQESRTDATGWLAGQWRDALHRPRVSTPASIEKHLAEVHSGDETYIGQLASAVRIATDAYHHRDDPQPQVPSNAERLAAMRPDIDPATGQDRRYQGESPEDIAAAEAALAASIGYAADQSTPESEFDGNPEVRYYPTGDDALVAIMEQQRLMMGLLRSVGAAIGLNVDDASIGAMAELWGVLPGAGQLITDSADESLSAQLATPTPPNAFSTWWGTADHNAPADGTAAG